MRLNERAFALTANCILAVFTLGPAALAQGPCAWHAAADAPEAQFEAPSVVIDGKLVVFGGFLPGLVASSRVNAYDPATDTWSALADLPQPITHSGFAKDGRNIWFAGGFLGDHPGPVVDSVWVYDVDLDAYHAGPNLPAPRGSGGLFRTKRTLHFVGGVASDRNTDQADHWVLDLDNPTGWTASAPLPVARNHFAAETLFGRGYVIGGQTRHDNSPTDVADVHVWDQQTGWAQLADLPFPRSHFESATFRMNGRLVVAGGRANTLGIAAVSEITQYDPVADAWSALAPLPTGLLGPAGKVLGDQIVITGGGPNPNTSSALTFRRHVQTAEFARLRVNSGAGALALTDPWCAEMGAQGGKVWTNKKLGPVAGTQDDALYESERTATNAQPTHFGYSLPVPDGEYLLRLHFAEIFFGAPGGVSGGPGKRVFDVTVEGQLALDDYDLWADVGPATAVVHDLPVVVADGALDMSFDSSVNRPKLSGYELLPLARTGSYCPASPNSVGPGADLAWSGTTSVAADDLALFVTGLPPGANARWLQSAVQANKPFAAGSLCVGPKIYRLGISAKADGRGARLDELDLAQPAPANASIAPGETWNFQLWYRDSAQTTSNLSSALSLTFLP